MQSNSEKSSEFAGTPVTKRPYPSSPSGSPAGIHQSGSSNAQLVYVRRKLDHEHSRMSASAHQDSLGSQEAKKNEPLRTPDKTLEVPKKEPDLFPDTLGTCPNVMSVSPSASAKPAAAAATAVPEQKNTTIMAGTQMPPDPPRASNQNWKERYVQLQMFLKKCDQSTHEDYIRRLWSLSALGRNQYAIDLEKRAMNLFAEEGKELQRMKFLNILGENNPDDPPLL